MGQLSASDMVARVRSALGNVQTEQLPDAYILSFLNNAQLRITTKYNMTEYCETENVTTVAGTAEYTMTGTDVLVIENVVNTTSKFDLKRCDETDYDLWISTTSVTGIPTHYFTSAISGNADTKKITFFPTPNGAYVMRVRYKVLPTQLATTPTTSVNYSVLASHWDFTLIYYAIADAWYHMSEFEKGDKFMQLAQRSEAEAWRMTNYPTEVESVTGRAARGGIRMGR